MEFGQKYRAQRVATDPETGKPIYHSNGEPVKEAANPELHYAIASGAIPAFPDLGSLGFIYRGFWQLSPRRQIGYGSGGIAYSDIMEWCDRNIGDDPEHAERASLYLMALDNHYCSWVSDRRQMEMDRAKSKSNRKLR